MNRYLYLFIIALSTLRLSAVNIDCEPGLLSSKADNPAALTELVLTGSADASDFRFLTENCPELRTLDMSALTIAAYLGDTPGMATSYAAGLIPPAAFAASKISNISLPANCTVGDFAFAGSQLVSVVIPDNTVVGNGAFSHCASLTEVTVGSNVTMRHSVFRYCTALGSVVGSENISAIPDYAFAGCSALGSFSFGSCLRSIGVSAFENSGIRELALGGCSALVSVGDRAFASMPELVSVNLPAQLDNFGKGVFFDDTALAEINLPDGLTSLAPFMLKDAAGVEQLVLPKNTASVGDYALMGLSKVTDMTLPASLESIGTGAMENMTALTAIDATALTAVPATGSDAWAGVAPENVTVNVDPTLENAFKSALQWQDFNIVGGQVSTGINSVQSSVRAAFDGYTLVVESTGQAIKTLTVADVSGRLLIDKGNMEANVITADTSHFDNSVFIIACTLADGSRAVAKLAR